MRPQARTIERLTKEGHLCGMVERWIPIKGHPGGGIRKDLFDCLDLICLRNGKIVGIQCGAMSGHAAHVAKCMASESLKKWLACEGAEFEIWSWGKRASRKKDGSKGAPRWAAKVQGVYVSAGKLIRFPLEPAIL